MTDLCSTLSRRHDEPISATASRVERWLLVEHRGAWGPPTVPMARMPHQLSSSLAAAANAARARLVLIRRPHVRGTRDEGPGRWIFAVDSRPGHELVLARHVDTDAELVGLEPPYGADPSDGWHPVGQRLWLVCTHGRHDRCCAVRGRPVAQALLSHLPDHTWECTHTGGDRFAANVVVLPDGLYLGRVEPEEVVRLADELDAGTLPEDRLRGRSSLSLPAQAAQHFAREATGRWGVDDLAPVEQANAGADHWRVRLGGEAPVEVTVRYDRQGGGEPRLLTCGADSAKVAPVFRLVALD